MERFVHAISRVKPLRSVTQVTQSSSLCKCLSVRDLIAYGVGCSVGAGVYSLVGVAAAIAGPATSLSFLVSGIACIFTSLTYSEFSARVPVTGSAYTFVYVTFGELPAWLIGWNLTLGYGISAAGIARSWAAYAETLLSQLGITIPHWLVRYDIEGSLSLSILAAFLVVACTVILLAGVKESAGFNTFITVLNISVLLFVICFGSTEIELQNWEPFVPNGLQSVITTAGVVFFAYLGFDMVACLAEEVADPQKNLPIGIISSLLISMAIYIGVSLVVTGMAPQEVLGGDIPLINAFTYHQSTWAAKIVSYGSIFGLTTAAFTCLMGQPRIFYQMAKDGLLPRILGVVNSRTLVPVASTIVTGVLVAVVALVFDLSFLANVISCGTLQVFTFVNAGVLILRLKSPESSPMELTTSLGSFLVASLGLSLAMAFNWHAIFQVAFGLALGIAFGRLSRLEHIIEQDVAFECPWVPLIPCLGIFSNIWMMASLPLSGWFGVAIWLSIGLLVYLCYGIHHSQLNSYDIKPSLMEQSPLKVQVSL